MIRLIHCSLFLLALVCSATIAIADDADWSDSLEQSLKTAAVSGQPVFVKFEADWCAPCRMLSKQFSKPGFKKIQSKCLLVRIDVDQQLELAQTYKVESIPTVLLIDSNGQVIADKVGAGELDEWVEWFEQAVDGTEFEMPDVLAVAGPPTRTEVKELLGFLNSRDAAKRQVAMERLAAFPTLSRGRLIESLQPAGKLAQKLSVLAILDRWQAPVQGLDPWVETSFSEDRLERLRTWEQTPLDELASPAIKFTENDLQTAQEEIDRLLKTRNVRASLSRLTQYGSQLLPYVYQRLASSETDQETSRLTALRYWLTASNELRLGWYGGLMELAAPNADSRRAAANVLVERATTDDQNLLLELFADSDPLVRELSLRGLQQVGAEKTDEALANLLKDPDKNVRAAVLKQFATAEATQMAPQVAEYLKTETDGDLIVHAIRFMRETSGNRAVDAVLAFCDHESWQVRAEVAEALGKIDADDLSVATRKARNAAVVKFLSDEDGFVISRALTALPDEPKKQTVVDLTEIAFARPSIAKGIADWMADRGRYDSDNRRKILPSLRRFLDHKEAGVRVVGVTALAKIDPASLTDAQLSPLLEDDDSSVRVAALDALLVKFGSFHSSAVFENVSGGMADRNNGMGQRPQRRSSFFGNVLGSLFGRPRSRPVEVDPSADEAEEDVIDAAVKEAEVMQDLVDADKDTAATSPDEASDDELTAESSIERSGRAARIGCF